MKSQTIETMKAIVIGASETLEYLGIKSENLNGSERASAIIRMNELNDMYHVLCAWTTPEPSGVQMPILKHRDTEFNAFERKQIGKNKPPDSEALLRQSIGSHNRGVIDRAAELLEKLADDEILRGEDRSACRSCAAGLNAVYDVQTAAFYGKPVVYREVKK